MKIRVRDFILNARATPKGYWTMPQLDDIDYPQTGNTECFGIEENSYWFRHRNNCIGRLLDLYPPTGCILDIGAGNGYVSLLAKMRGFDVILLEPGLDGVLNAKKRGLEHVVCGSLENARIGKNSFGGVFLFDVLEHIRDDKKFLEKSRGILKKNGLVFLTVPASPVLWSSEDDLAGHFRRYSLTELENMLVINGFEVLYSSYYFTLLYLPILLTRCLPEKIFNVRKKDFRLKREDYVVKSPAIDGILRHLFHWETFFMGKRRIFLGSSIILAGRKK